MLAHIISLLLCNNLFYALVESYSILSLSVKEKWKCIEHANIIYHNLMKSRKKSSKKWHCFKKPKEIKSLKYKIRVRRKINFVFILKIEISKSFSRKLC